MSVIRVGGDGGYRGPQLPADEPTREERDEAFNRGCQARIDGKPLVGANPYERHSSLWRIWRSGWCDVSHHWAEANALPHVHRRLPALREDAEVTTDEEPDQ